MIPKPFKTSKCLPASRTVNQHISFGTIKQNNENKKTEAETSRQIKVLKRGNEGKRERVITDPKAKFNQAWEDNNMIRQKSGTPLLNREVRFHLYSREP